MNSCRLLKINKSFLVSQFAVTKNAAIILGVSKISLLISAISTCMLNLDCTLTMTSTKPIESSSPDVSKEVSGPISNEQMRERSWIKNNIIFSESIVDILSSIKIRTFTCQDRILESSHNKSSSRHIGGQEVSICYV